jgi:anti-sigma-K factor RskA
MSATEPTGPEHEGPDVTAGEYVLGVLGAADYAVAGRRAATDPAFAAEVAGWEARLTHLIERLDAVEPPATLWPAIAAQLRGTVTPFPARQNYWNSLALWRGVAAGATALAAACLVLVVLPRTPGPVPTPVPAPTPPAPSLAVARLEAPHGGAAFVATFNEAKRQLVIVPTGKPGPADRSAQLWLMPAKSAPVPLGVFTGRMTLVVEVPAGVKADSLLGVSLEPLGGSPSGAPTGPVIATGTLMRI